MTKAHPLDLRIEPEHVREVFVEGMSNMGFNHEYKGDGFTCSMHQFVHRDGTTINVALPLIPMTLGEIREKVREVTDALTSPSD